jgi:hypothetical protein
MPRDITHQLQAAIALAVASGKTREEIDKMAYLMRQEAQAEEGAPLVPDDKPLPEAVPVTPSVDLSDVAVAPLPEPKPKARPKTRPKARRAPPPPSDDDMPPAA